MIKRLIRRIFGRFAGAPAASEAGVSYGAKPVAEGTGGAQVSATPAARRAARASRGKAARGPVMVPVATHGIDPKLVSANAVRVTHGLQEAGFKAFVVGGAVRDLLLGIKPKDFDIATDATPEQIQRLFRRAHIIGRRFRLVHVMFGADTIEVSTFRANVENAVAAQAEQRKTEAHAPPPEAPRSGRRSRNDSAAGQHVSDEHGRVLRDNVFGSQEDDAARRDFTVNALFYDPAAQTVIDYHHGVADVKARTLRIIGDAEKRYREDPVRMLRAVRFAAKLGFSIDDATRAPIASLAPLLENVPTARLFDEMLKLFMSGHALACLQRLRAEGLHHGVLPLLDVVLEQPLGERFVTLALQSTDERIRLGKPTSPSFLFACLLWHEVLKLWEEGKARGEYPIPALATAMDKVLDAQTEKLAIQRRHASDMREIWGLQPRLERRTGRSPWRLIEHLRFRAGYDFLLLRCAAGECDASLGDWWTRFIDADAAGREALQEGVAGSESNPAAAKKKRRRKKRIEPHAGAPGLPSEEDNEESDHEEEPASTPATPNEEPTEAELGPEDGAADAARPKPRRRRPRRRPADPAP